MRAGVSVRRRVLAVLFVVGLAGCDWTAYLQGNSRSGLATYEDGFNPTTASSLRLNWEASATDQQSGVFSQPAVVNGKVYWGSYDGYERATDTDGRPVWQTYLGQTPSPPDCLAGHIGVVSSATVRSDVPIGNARSVLYVGGGDAHVYALDAETGAVLWSQGIATSAADFVWSSPAVFGNSVYIGVASYGDCPLVAGRLVQLDRMTGVVQHTFDLVPAGCTGAGVWGSPTVDEAAGTIYFTTGNGGDCSTDEPLAQAVVELRASDLSIVGSWSVPAADAVDDGDFGSTPTLFAGEIGNQHRDLVGAVNKNGVYYTFVRDALGAGPVWSTHISDGGEYPAIGEGDIASSAFDGTKLYVGGENGSIGTQSCTGSLSALDPSTGAFIWRHCFTDGFVLGGVTGTSGGVVAVGEGSNIAVLSTSTGDVRFTFTGAGTFFGPPSIANGTLYEGDTSGTLYALTT